MQAITAEMMKEWLFSGPLLIVSYNLFPNQSQSTELREQESLSFPHPKYTTAQFAPILSHTFWRFREADRQAALSVLCSTEQRSQARFLFSEQRRDYNTNEDVSWKRSVLFGLVVPLLAWKLQEENSKNSPKQRWQASRSSRRQIAVIQKASAYIKAPDFIGNSLPKV